MLQPTPNAFSTITLPNGVTLNNLAAQVEENKKLIAEHYNIDRVLADFGLRVLGKLTVAPVAPGTEYGDAYLVGTEEPYSVYVWTRANPTIGQDEDYWLNIGPIAIEGPQGLPGPQGIQGETGKSTRWYVFSNQSTPPNTPNAYTAGDMALITLTGANYGNVYLYNGTNWILNGNIKGPQGPQGPQGPIGPQGIQGVAGPAGPQGSPAPIATIRGTVSNVDALPTPTPATRGDAYLIDNDVYVIFGPDNALTWMNIGPLNAGTVVYEGGLAKGTWSADTKLNVPANGIPTGTGERILTINQQGVVNHRYATGFTVGSIPLYSSAAAQNSLIPADATIYAAMPLADGHVANKKYVDEAVANAGGGASAYEHNILITARTVDDGFVRILSRFVNNDGTAASSLETLLAAMAANVPYMTSGYIREPSGYINLINTIKKDNNGYLAISDLSVYLSNPVQGVYALDSYIQEDTPIREDYNWWKMGTIEVQDTVVQIH